MRLDIDHPLPDLTALDSSSDTPASLHDRIAGRWAVVLVYRGHW